MDERLQGRHLLLVALGLFLYVFVLYRHAPGFDFSLFDDHLILLNQPQLFGPGPFTERLAAIFLNDFPREEPLLVRDLSWLLDGRLFGFGNPYGYHFFNVIYHGATAIALFGFVLLVSGRAAPAIGTAVVFASLAVHVEPVAWIMGRKDLLAGLFLYLLLIAELRFQRAGHSRAKVLWYLAGLLFLVAACLSKISAVVYPGVLLLLKCALELEDSSGGKRLRWLGRALVQVVPHFVLAALIYGWYRGVLADYGVLERASTFSLQQKLEILALVDPLVLLRYLDLILMPDSLSIQYTWAGIEADLGWAHRLIAIVVLVALIGVTGYLIFRRPRIAFFVLGFLVLMLPYLNLVHFGWWYANRYIYAATGFLIAPVLLWAWPRDRRPKSLVTAAVIGVVLVWNLLAQHRYLPVWRDAESLFAYEAGLPQAILATRNNQASMYVSLALRSPPEQRSGVIERGLAVTEQILRDHAGSSAPELVLSYYAQGSLRVLADAEPAQQLESFQRAHAIDPRHVGVNTALGEVYFELADQASDPGLSLIHI